MWPAHQRQTQSQKGNAFADKIAKQAAQGEIKVLSLTENALNDKILQDMQQQSPKQEQELWKRKGAHLKNGIYI